MSLKIVWKYLRQNFALLIFSALFLITLSYIIHETVEHSALFHQWGSSQEAKPDLHEDVNIFIIVMHIMAISGFVMMVLMAGNILNLVRMNIRTQGIYKKVHRQMQAIETSRDGVSILNNDGIFTYMNKAHASCYGYDYAEDLIGQSWRILYDAEWVQRFENDVFPELHQQGWWFGSGYGHKKDGSKFPQEVSLNLLDDGGLICTVRDVTEKVEKDHLLHIIKLAVEAADDGIAITDSKHKFLFMNQSFLTIHGYEPEDRPSLIGADWRSVYNELGQEMINSIVLPTTDLKGSWTGKTTVMKKDGTLFSGDASLTKMSDGLILGVMRDISDRAIAEREGELLREQLFHTQKMEAIIRLTSGVASDFDSVLSTICKNAEQIRDGVATSNKDTAKAILTAAHKVENLVDKLQAFSSSKSRRPEVIDLKKNILQFNDLIDGQVPSSIALTYDINIDDAYVYAHSSQIDQILMNLCLNAIEAMHSGDGKISITVNKPKKDFVMPDIVEDMPDRTVASVVRLRHSRGKSFLVTGYMLKDHDYIQISVADTGGGIAQDILPNIFDPFFTTKVGKGPAGLGLSTVHGLMIGGNGAIVVEAVPEKGTTVHLFLPQSDVLEYHARARAKAAQ